MGGGQPGAKMVRQWDSVAPLSPCQQWWGHLHTYLPSQWSGSAIPHAVPFCLCFSLPYTYHKDNRARLTEKAGDEERMGWKGKWREKRGGQLMVREESKGAIKGGEDLVKRGRATESSKKKKGWERTSGSSWAEIVIAPFFLYWQKGQAPVHACVKAWTTYWVHTVHLVFESSQQLKDDFRATEASL